MKNTQLHFKIVENPANHEQLLDIRLNQPLCLKPQHSPAGSLEVWTVLFINSIKDTFNGFGNIDDDVWIGTD